MILMDEFNRFEKNKKSKSKLIYITIALLFIVSLSIGYSIFYSELVISPQAYVTPYRNKFKVYFSKSRDKLDINNIEAIKSSDNIDATNAIINNGGVSSMSRMNITFTESGQSVKYIFYARNEGEYRAYLNNIIFENVNNTDSFKKCTSISGYSQDQIDAACNLIHVKLTINDSSEYTSTAKVTNHILNINNSDKIELEISYEATSTITDEDFRVEFGDIALIYSTVGDYDVESSSGQSAINNENTLYNLMLRNEYGLNNARNAKIKIGQRNVPSFSSIASTKEGLFETVDDDGPVYYYRGDVNNNHVIFGGFCWKIVRTTGTGGVKLIYDGVPSNGVCNNTGTATHIKTAAFNSNYNSLAYVGYMYGEARITKSDDITAKTTNVIFSNNATYNSATDMYELDMNNSYEMIPSNWNSSNTSVNYTQVVKKHYTCLDNRTSCREVYYVNAIYSSDKKVYYQTLSNGETIDDLIDMMLTSSDNRKSSNAKTQIDSWYEKNLINYGSYLEDTIFCNDRTITSYGGWNKDNTNYDGWMYFGARNRNYILYKPSLECPNLNDKFTVNYGRGNGDLTYPVGLLTADEMAMAGGKYNTANSSYYLYNGQYQWSLSPSNFYYWFATGWRMNSTGNLYDNYVTYSIGLRPVVSLKPGTMVSGGDGSSSSPYIIG